MEINVKLIRTQTQGKAVRGEISFPIGDKTYTYPTLENKDFLIPAGRYPLKRTWSPKFKKLLPLLLDVPDREGIRIHQGSRPEHSEGCILVEPIAQMNLDIMFNCAELHYEPEIDAPIRLDVFIEIKNLSTRLCKE